MRIMVGDGRVLEGTAVQIVEAMQYVAFGKENMSLGEYVDSSAIEAQRMMGVELNIEGETDEEKAKSFVKEILNAGLAKKI